MYGYILFSIDSNVLIDQYVYTDEGFNHDQEVRINTSSTSK